MEPLLKIRQAFKFVLFGGLLLVFFIATLPLYPFLRIYPEYIRHLVSVIIQIIAKSMLCLLGAKISINKLHHENKGQLIICNHMSYLDMLVILSQYKTSFITSNEIKKTPFLGQICDLAGCFYTDRKNKKNIYLEVKTVREAILKGNTITFFPEATSTNAEEIKRFRKPFFYAAEGTSIPITTIALNYKLINNSPFCHNNRDQICWYDDMSFLPHLWNLMRINSLNIELKINKIKVKDSIEDTVFDCETYIKENVKLLNRSSEQQFF